MKNNLTDWDIYCSNTPAVPISFYGFSTDIGTINRFNARYRAAKSYKGIKLSDYSEQTANGYSSFVKVMFVYSAFESFMKIYNIKNISETHDLVSNYHNTQLIYDIKQLDINNKFYDFIYERLRSQPQSELDKYFKDQHFNSLYLVSSIRHIFSHGHLTPNARGSDPEKVRMICDKLCDFTLKLMDNEFSKSIKKFEEIEKHMHS